MIWDWFALISLTLYEYSKQQQGGLLAVILIPSFAAVLVCTGCFAVGRLIDIHYSSSISQAISLIIATFLTALAMLVWLGAPYIKPAIDQAIKAWQTEYVNDSNWQAETYQQIYWAVKALHGPDGNPLENFEGNSPPGSSGSTIPIKSAQARHLTANIEISRLTEHFCSTHPFLDRILGANEQTLPKLLKQDIDNYFQQNPGQISYPRERAISLAGNRMLSILEQRLQGIVFRLRLIVALTMSVVWIPLYTWSARRALKNLEPITP